MKRIAGAPEAEAFKLGLFALVRLKAYEPLAAAVLDGGQPVTTWWPVAYALQRIEDPRAAPALLQLLDGPGPLHARVRRARARARSRTPSAVKPLARAARPGGEEPARADGRVRFARWPSLARPTRREPLVASGEHADRRIPTSGSKPSTALGTLRAADGLADRPGSLDR